MKIKQQCTLITFFMLFTLFSLFSAGIAEAAGTLKVTFLYKDSSGVETPLNRAYVYLHDGQKQAPMEKFFSQADYILGPSDSYGRISASVPEGNYYIRITRRNPLPASPDPLGPPRSMDYTWNQTNTITISPNAVTDLGVKYAYFFSAVPIIVSGTVKTTAGVPVAGRYVRAQTEPCIEMYYNGPDDPNNHGSNHCGPVKFLSQNLTDSNGRYTIQLRDAGTYYFYESLCLGDRHRTYQGNPVCIGTGTGPRTLQAGDNVTVDIVIYCSTCY